MHCLQCSNRLYAAGGRNCITENILLYICFLKINWEFQTWYVPRLCNSIGQDMFQRMFQILLSIELRRTQINQLQKNYSHKLFSLEFYQNLTCICFQIKKCIYCKSLFEVSYAFLGGDFKSFHKYQEQCTNNQKISSSTDATCDFL